MMYFGQTEIIRTVLLECIVFTQVLSTCTLTADDDCTVRIVRLEEISVIPTAVATVFDADGQVLDRFQIGKHIIVERVIIRIVLFHTGLEKWIAVICREVIGLRETVRTVGITRSDIRKLAQSRTDHIIFGKRDGLFCIGISGIKTYLQPISDIRIYVDTETGACETGTYSGTVLVQITAGQ